MNLHPRYRFLLIGLLFILMVPGLTSPAEAHGQGIIIVGQMDRSRPEPSPDGACGSDYLPAGRTSLLYRPGYNWNAATIYTLSHNGRLFLCVTGMPVGTATNRLTVAFDVNHNGGAAPDAADRRFGVSQSGISTLEQGNGIGWSTAPPTPVQNWSVMVNENDLDWSAEFVINADMLGGNRPLSNIGIYIQQLDVRNVGDNFGWHQRATPLGPETWPDLFWGMPQNSTRPLQLDVSRVTQGMDFDPGTGWAYFKVANRDTLIRAQLYSGGTLGPIATGLCGVRLVAINTGGINVPTTAPEQIVPISFTPGPLVNAAPVGFFNGNSTVNCWIPGTYLQQSGLYELRIEARQEGSSTAQSFALGRFFFAYPRDYTLFLVRGKYPDGHPAAILWNGSHTANMISGVADIQRQIPTQRGYGPLERTGDTNRTDAPGVRYVIHPMIMACRTSPVGECDANFRRFTQLVLADFNARLRHTAETTGASVDYVRQNVLGFSTPLTGGGQTQYWAGGYNSIGIGVDADPDGGTAIVQTHEVVHALGRPHFPLSLFSPGVQGPMVNFRTGRDVLRPKYTIYPFFARDYISYYNDAVSWKAIYDTLSVPHARTPHGGGQPIYMVSGTLNSTDTLTVSHSAAYFESYGDVTSDDPTAPYTLYFYDSGAAELGKLHFDIPFEVSEDEVPPLVGFNLFAPLPAGTASVEIRKGGTLLWNQTFSATPPTVSGVNAGVQADTVYLSWSASDPDSTSLRYSLYYQKSPTDTEILLTDALTDTFFTFDATQTGGTPNGQIRVEATDGYSTGSASSNTFVIGDKAPIVSITAPAADVTVVAGSRLRLDGIAEDYTTGPLTGAAVRWVSSIDGDLGNGLPLDTSLSPGTHTLSLVATAPSGLSATDTMTLTVEADSDGDGLPDVYEVQHSCLDKSVADSHLDADVDTLAAYGEWQWATNPCNPDSDNDGSSDGDETIYGGNPDDPTTQPVPLSLGVDVSPVSLTCDATTVTRSVSAASGVAWSATTEAMWLSLSGSSTGNGTLTIKGLCDGLPDGTYPTDVYVAANGDMRHIPVTLTVGDTPSSMGSLYLPLIQRH